jgi:hypothetical protein
VVDVLGALADVVVEPVDGGAPAKGRTRWSWVVGAGAVVVEAVDH